MRIPARSTFPFLGTMTVVGVVCFLLLSEAATTSAFVQQQPSPSSSSSSSSSSLSVRSVLTSSSSSFSSSSSSWKRPKLQNNGLRRPIPLGGKKTSLRILESTLTSTSSSEEVTPTTSSLSSIQEGQQQQQQSDEQRDGVDSLSLNDPSSLDGQANSESTPQSLSSSSSSDDATKKKVLLLSTNIINNLTTNQRSILSASMLIIIDVLFRKLFQRMAVPFPSSLGGCCALLLAMLLTTTTTTTTTGNLRQQQQQSTIYNALSPGAALLAKWLPVFFVPSLVTLPLVGSVGNTLEILKILSVIVGGFYFTLLSTAGSVLAVTKLFGDKQPKQQQQEQQQQQRPISVTGVSVSTTPPTSPPPTSKPFSDILMNNLRMWMGVTGIASLVALKSGSKLAGVAAISTPLVTCFGLFTTLCSFVYGANLPKKFTSIVHPLVTCTALTWMTTTLFGSITNRSFGELLLSYKMGNGIRGLYQTGPGDILLFLLGPAVLSLAVSMYEKRTLIRDNAKEIATAVTVSSIGGLVGTAWMVRFIRLTQPTMRIALLSRNITSPLAMAIATILGGPNPMTATTISLAVSMVVVTGLFGANFGSKILSSLGITNPVARGMGIGAAAHGLGTAAFVNEKDAFPFAAISMALTATACTVLVSIPVIKKLILTIALGGI